MLATFSLLRNTKGGRRADYSYSHLVTRSSEKRRIEMVGRATKAAASKFAFSRRSLGTPGWPSEADCDQMTFGRAAAQDWMLRDKSLAPGDASRPMNVQRL